jgi:hypothetical protein
VPPGLGRRGRAGRASPRPEPGAGSAGPGAAQRRRLIKYGSIRQRSGPGSDRDRAVTSCANRTIGLFVPKASTNADYQRRGTPDLGRTVRGCPLASAAGGGDCYSLGYSASGAHPGDPSAGGHWPRGLPISHSWPNGSKIRPKRQPCSSAISDAGVAPNSTACANIVSGSSTTSKVRPVAPPIAAGLKRGPSSPPEETQNAASPIASCATISSPHRPGEGPWPRRPPRRTRLPQQRGRSTVPAGYSPCWVSVAAWPITQGSSCDLLLRSSLHDRPRPRCFQVRGHLWLCVPRIPSTALTSRLAIPAAWP